MRYHNTQFDLNYLKQLISSNLLLLEFHQSFIRFFSRFATIF